MSIGTIAGASLGVKNLNGKLKPKFGIVGIVSLLILVLAMLGFMVFLVCGVMVINIEFIAIGTVGFLSVGYLLLISPYAQSSKNYKIEFPNDGSLEGFKLFYKGKLVSIQYRIDQHGKIMLASDQRRLESVSYADGAEMDNFTKYRILNYFGKWLHDQGLFSGDNTVTFEKL